MKEQKTNKKANTKKTPVKKTAVKKETVKKPATKKPVVKETVKKVDTKKTNTVRRNRIIVLSLIVALVLTGIIALAFAHKGKCKNNEEINLKFESRVEKLNTFNTGDYYKFGWLQVQGTHMDLPIIDSRSNGKYDEINYSYGWLSSFYSDGDNREVLIGHNILNVSNEPMLPDENLENFEELMAFSYYGFAKNNLYVQYTKDGKDEIYAIYAIGFYDYSYDRAEGINDKEELAEYIKETKKNSIYDYDIDVDSSDRLLQIKTCTRMFGNEKNQQFVIDLRKLRDDEKAIKYDVKTTKRYKKLNLKDQKV